jgi:hypothetical protein
LVAEGFQMHLDRRHTDDRAYLDAQFRETRGRIERTIYLNDPSKLARSLIRDGS